MQPPRIFRVCATRADCHVPPQELTTREAKTVDKAKASGEAVSTAWDKFYKDEVICAAPPASSVGARRALTVTCPRRSSPLSKPRQWTSRWRQAQQYPPRGTRHTRER